MDVELTVDYDNTINKWRRHTIDYSVDKLMLMVHQPVVEISIGDIFKTSSSKSVKLRACDIYGFNQFDLSFLNAKK